MGNDLLKKLCFVIDVQVKTKQVNQLRRYLQRGVAINSQTPMPLVAC